MLLSTSPAKIGKILQMKIIYGLRNLAPASKKKVTTIGMFDGVHRGHQKVLKKVVSEAKKRGLQSLVLTFEPHPVEVIKPGTHPSLLTSAPLKTELMAELGVGMLVVCHFTKALARYAPAEFIDKILIKKLNTGLVVVGENFKFGKGAQGDVSFLKNYGKKKGLSVISVPTFFLKKGAISSTRIRKLLEDGRIEESKEILGYFPRIIGKVVKGEEAARRLGFSTANIRIPDKALVPGKGIYAGWVRFNKKRKKGAIYIGTSPTLGLKKLRIEAHILGFSGNLYGKEVEIEILKKVRGEISFKTPQDLSKRIEKDLEIVEKIFKV